jgi:hypothetical protein
MPQNLGQLSRLAVTRAAALLNSDPSADAVVIPVRWPGKEFGADAEAGQLQNAESIMFVVDRTLPLGQATHYAYRFGKVAAKDDPHGGTVGWAVVSHGPVGSQGFSVTLTEQIEPTGP